MASINGTRKCCATCQLWGGARGLNSSKRFVEIPSEKLKGPCVRISPNQQQEGIYLCGHFKKWSALK